MVNAILLLSVIVHSLANIGLFLRIWWARDCSGISVKSQFLYAVVFTTRYLDVFTTSLSIENISFKILSVLLVFLTVFSIESFFYKTYEKKYDTSRVEILIIPCFVAALLMNHEFSTLEVLWTFSIYLETVAMIPQFNFIRKAKRIDKHVLSYIAAKTIYTGLMIANWAYRYFKEGHYDNIRLAAAIIQFVLFYDFFLRVLPPLCTPKVNRQPIVSTIEVDVESAENRVAGHFSSNVSNNAVLTPDILTGVKNDKVNLLVPE